MAGAVIGSLRVDLGMNSAQFKKGLADVQSGMQKFAKSTKAVMVAVGAAAVAAGAALSITIKNAIGRAVASMRSADLAGATFEQFQRATYAAKAFGIESEKLADIYKDVNDKLGDFFQTGAGPMADFFENIAPKVGLTADAFRNLSGPDALQAYYNALEKAGVSQSEMTFYLEAIASDATALIPLLKDNGEEFARLGDEAQRTGRILSDETGRAAVEFSQTMTGIQGVMDGVVNKIMEAVLPTLRNLAETLASPKFAESAQAIAVGVVEALNTIAGAVVWVVDKLNELRATMEWIGSHDMFGREIKAPERVPGVPSLDEYVSQQKAMEKLRSDLTNGAQADLGGFDSLFGGSRSGSNKKIDDFFKPVITGASAASASVTDLTSGIKSSGEALSQWGDMGTQVTSTLADGFTNLFTGLIDGTASAQDAVTGLMKSLGSMFLNSGFQALFGGFGGGGFMSGLFGGGGGYTPGFGAFGAFANGTNNAPGGMAWVGEEGPELMNVPRGAQILPHDKSMAFAANQNAANGNNTSVALNVTVNGNPAGWGAQIANALTEFSRNELPSRVQQINKDPHGIG